MRSWMVRATSTLAALALVLGLSDRLEAQGVTTGAISGLVQDSAGNPLENAAVQVVYIPTGFRSNATTNSSGLYIVQGLEPGGPYRVTARAIGFRATTREDVRVSIGQTFRAPFSLTPTTVELADITVISEDPTGLFAPSRQGTATTIGDSALRRLPTLNRDFADFVKLTPQVAVRDGDEGGISVVGQNNRFNTVQVDGATVNDRFGLGRTGQTGGQAGGRAVGLDAVKEYQVLLAPYDVRQGNFTGALINAVTKNGTNDLEGSAFFFYRDESLANDPLGLTEFNQKQFGGSLGGPIVRDQAHFFVNVELNRRATPAAGPFFGSTDRAPLVTQADVTRFQSILDGYGLESGDGELFNRSNPLLNMLARFDLQVGSSSRLVFRYGYNEAKDDNFSRTTSPTNPIFNLSSTAYRFENSTHNPALQFFTNFAGGASNEFLVSYQRIRDARTPAVVSPLVTVQGLAQPSGTGVARLQSGSEQFSQGNALDQDFFELTNNFTKPMGEHLITIGTRNEFYNVRNLFAQSSYGVWTFNSLDDFQNGVADRYAVAGSVGGGTTGEASFNTATLGFYVQDQWRASPRLNLTLGLRADIPLFFDQPVYDERVADDFGGERTVPSGQVLLAPRAGFNLDLNGDQTTQIRGGLGMFAGAPAFVWMSNAYANTGTGINQLTCSPGNTPAFSATLPPSVACLDGQTIGPGNTIGEVDLIGDETEFPQVLRANFAVDQRLGSGLVGTIEGIYTKGINDYFIVNRNLNAPLGVDQTGRTVYGTFNASGAPTPSYFDVATYGPSFSGGVYELLNTSENYSWSLSGQLQKRFAGSLLVTAGYTYSEAQDVASFTSSRAISNWQFGRVYSDDQLGDTRATSSFSRPHRLVIGTSFTMPWERFQTDVSFTYVGQSGQPYTYIAGGASGRGDLNADGSNGNDPIYIPTSASDPTQMMFDPITGAGGVVLLTAAEQATAFDEFIDGDACLSRQRGQIMERNSCRNPWQNFLDMSIRQTLPTIARQQLTLEIGVFNVLNLLNSDWGRIRTAGGGIFYTEALLQQVGATPGTVETSQPIFEFDPANVEEQYEVTSSPSNSYQVQVGLRYAF